MQRARHITLKTMELPEGRKKLNKNIYKKRSTLISDSKNSKHGDTIHKNRTLYNWEANRQTENTLIWIWFRKNNPRPLETVSTFCINHVVRWGNGWRVEVSTLGPDVSPQTVLRWWCQSASLWHFSAPDTCLNNKLGREASERVLNEWLCVYLWVHVCGCMLCQNLSSFTLVLLYPTHPTFPPSPSTPHAPHPTLSPISQGSASGWTILLT